MYEPPGRASELARIDAVRRSALAGAGGLVLVTGEAGIGKTRLAHAALQRAAAAGMTTARGWCIDDPAAPTLWTWRRVARDVPALGAVLSEAADHRDADAHFRLAERVGAELSAAAGGTGLAVLLEDQHWADTLTAALLRCLLPELGTMRVLLLVTAREEHAVQSPFGRLLPDLVRSPLVTTIQLAGLTTAAVSDWLANDAAMRGWAPRAAELVRRTSGNPLLITALASAQPPQAGATGADLVERPAWRAVLLAPYRTLPEPARRTVATAAVLAERLLPQVLSDVLGIPVADIGDHLSAAVTAGILRFGETGLAFHHALVRDAVVAELGAAERARIHEAVALALEKVDDPAYAGLAATHWSHVGTRAAAERCRDLAVRAAQAQPLAPDRGVALALLALDACRALGAGDDELAERLLATARFQWDAGLLADTLDSCARGMDLAARAGRADLMAGFALIPQGMGSLEVAAIAAEMCRRALRVLPDGERALRARLLASCAVAGAEAAQLRAPGDERSPDALSAEALRVAREAGDLAAEIETIAARHLVLSYPQRIAEREQLTARATEIAERTPTLMGALWGRIWAADLATQRGDTVGLRQVITEVERVAAAYGSPVARWHALRLRTGAAVLVGDFDLARRIAGEGLEIAQRIGDLSMVGMHAALHTWIAGMRGDPDDLLDDVIETVLAAPPIPLVRAELPIVHALRGDHQRAAAALDALRDVPGRMPLGPRWYGTVASIGTGAVLLNDAALAEECHRLLLPTALWCAGDGGGSPVAAGSNEGPLGQLAQVAGQNAVAARHFERSIAVDDRIGAWPYAARARLGLAECLEQTDPARAVEVATAAAAELGRLDMPGPLARAQALLARHRTDVRPGEGPLSARELEVARLVAEPLTNQQIAERLYLSVRTVESHVRSALAKLDLTGRTELAIWTRERERRVSGRP
ncbi:AAA family ATPase [Cumulibacter manganitolerans]|uniref:AAA family ATPase n=1 Tax=Cumulibacter manganitolerans TaxID=1884992 RepID=UPI001295AAE2|nr:AAA family ATPase [Cumulibacter manganitolerans]